MAKGKSSIGDSNHPHAVTALSNGGSFAYDANGNMTSRSVNGTETAHTYAAKNHMITASQIQGAAYRYVYDGDGKLVHISA